MPVYATMRGAQRCGRCSESISSKPNCITFMPGKANASRTLDDVGRDHTEILGDDREVAERRAHGGEQAEPGSGRPAAA